MVNHSLLLCVLLKFQLLKLFFYFLLSCVFFSFRQWAPPFKFVPVWLKVLYDPHFPSMLYALPGCISLFVFPFSARSYFMTPCSWWNCCSSSRSGCLGSGTGLWALWKVTALSPPPCITFWPELPRSTPAGKGGQGSKREFRGRALAGRFKAGEIAWLCCGDLAAET